MQRSGCVLIVDDHPLVRRALRRLLAGAGFEPREASSGEEALAMLRSRGAPDAVLLDLDLPGINGEEVLRSIRVSGIAVAVIIHSGALDDGALHGRLMAAGADACLRKPASPDAVLACLERLLAPSRCGSDGEAPAVRRAAAAGGPDSLSAVPTGCG